MLEVLGWIALLVVAYVVACYAWHTYKMRTDRYYRYKSFERLQDAEGERLAKRLRQVASTSENSEVRKLAEQLVGKGRD